MALDWLFWITLICIIINYMIRYCCLHCLISSQDGLCSLSEQLFHIVFLLIFQYVALCIIYSNALLICSEMRIITFSPEIIQGKDT